MQSLRQLLPFFRPYRWIVVLLILTTMLPVAMELTVPQLLAYVIDQGIRQGDMTAITRGVMVMLLAAILGAVATLGQGFCRAWLSQGFAFDLRNALFAHVQSFAFANFDRMHTGQIMTRLSSDVDIVRMFTSHGLSLLLRALTLIGGSTVLMLLLDWRLALVALALLPVAAVMIGWVIRTSHPIFLMVQQQLASLNTVVQESLAGVAVVKAFVREGHEIDRFSDANVDYRDQQIRVGRLLAVSMPVLTTLTNLGLVAVIWVGGVRVTQDSLTVGELVAFTNYLMIGMAPLLMLSNMLTMVAQAEASAQRVIDVMAEKPLLPAADKPYAGKMVGRLSFKHVSFQYDGDGGEAVLEDVTFRVEAGQQVALLGTTGSGKSTLVHLITRFYDVTGGQITIDGVDVRAWDVKTLRAQVGIVMQQTLLFSGTIRDNIAYGRPDASLEEVMAAAQVAQAHGFIQQLPAGYDSFVESRGANLSGGQRQRLAIARALLVEPAILILDDSTSAVDFDTEYHLQRSLQQMMRGRTTFIIAQRIHSVLNADQILILDQGHIIAQGTHHDLLQSSPIYREIYDSQLGDYEMAPGDHVGWGEEGYHKLASNLAAGSTRPPEREA